MKIPYTIPQNFSLLTLKPQYLLIIIASLLSPLWALEWGPLKVKHSVESNIKLIDSLPDRLVTPKQSSNTLKQVTSDVDTLNKPTPGPIIKKVIVSAGDTLMKIFTRIGLPPPLAFRAIKSLSEKYDPKSLTPGQELEFVFKPPLLFNPGERPNSIGKLVNIIFQPNLNQVYTITLDHHDQLTTKLLKTNTKTKLFHIQGRINSSLYLAAVKSKLPLRLLMEMIRIYSWDIDFQRSIRSGDQFEIMYEGEVTSTGILTRYGDLLFANLKLGKSNYPLYLFKAKDGSTDYFDNNGHSAQKSLMRTPINGARLSSGFGNRRHPILGFNKMHRGVDFAAPSGTPILAAGSGTIVFRSRNGSYGNYIRIRHNSIYSTAYAHMSRFNRAFKRGSRVRQGQIIGYVGTTGRSTGAHLHYEVLRRGRQTNPMRVKMPSEKRLTGAELLRFNNTKTRITNAAAKYGVQEKQLNTQSNLLP